MWYYVSGLVLNSAFLSFYSVQAFKVAATNEEKCMAADGEHDIGEWFDLAFDAGFGLHLANFIFFAFVEPHVRNVEKKHLLARR